jgi:hypothetical protein
MTQYVVRKRELTILVDWRINFLLKHIAPGKAIRRAFHEPSRSAIEIELDAMRLTGLARRREGYWVTTPMLRRHLNLKETFYRQSVKSGEVATFVFPKLMISHELRETLRRRAPSAARFFEKEVAPWSYEAHCLKGILEKYVDVVEPVTHAFYHVHGRRFISKTVIQAQPEFCPSPAQYFSGSDRLLDWQRRQIFQELEQRGLMSCEEHGEGLIWQPTSAGDDGGCKTGLEVLSKRL